jgi:hypothetical protein
MRKVLFPLLAILLGVGLPYLIVEGVYSVSRGKRPGTSLTYRLYQRLLHSGPPAPFDPHDQTSRVITDPLQFEAMMDVFKANGVGIGNSPFAELKTEAVNVNTEEDGGKVQKPNLRKTLWISARTADDESVR